MTALFIRTQSGRLLVMRGHSGQSGELSEVWPGEDFYGVTYSELRRLGDGRHEVEFATNRSSRTGLAQRIVSIVEEVGAIEFECSLGMLSKQMAAREVALLCMSNTIDAVLAGASAEMREHVCLFVRAANAVPGDEDDVSIGRPNLPRSVIREVVAACEDERCV
ncbi:hypothetical protein [Myxococcus sp. SDU36]|uniref:hypothetical protein n=1 Tax=Myxococcus sp. SDU36 TaxID=2831967 RepID=UPI0025437CE5|nr:hypothetical protein [Myxococcus sp. SDU36]WIG92886.1 hypothetical protein KGD87_19850 [Myxococcus sp. SDU36]